MGISSSISIDQFKSPLRVTARRLLKSRLTQFRRARKRAELIQELRKDLANMHRKQQELSRRLLQATAEVQRLRTEMARDETPMQLPDDPNLPHHSFGATMISVCVRLACAVGLRASEQVLKIFIEAFGIDEKIPNWTTIRTWLCRLGIAELEEPVEKADDWILFSDHSNQVGSEKVLVILGIRASRLPPLGQPLRHEDLRVLAVVPGVQWKQEDVAREYALVAERIGQPLALVTDGATELRESATGLENAGQTVIVLRDFKHIAANYLKHQLNADERFGEFMSKVGQTRNAVQQTELAHLRPPRSKPKARFMNLGEIIRWAEMALWQLRNPNSLGRQDVTAARMKDKLGWLLEFSDDVARWSRCQAVIDKSLTIINEEGLYSGAGANLKRALDFMDGCEASRQMITKLTNFVAESELQLAEGMRLPLSTEILESAFGLFKGLEKQQSKGGFTSLLAALPALVCTLTPERIRQGLSRVTTKSMRSWVTKHLGTTLASKRQRAYREFKTATT